MISKYPLRERFLFWFCDFSGVSVDRGYLLMSVLWRRKSSAISSGSPNSRPL